MRERKRITFLVDNFLLPSPAQQLLDRFLIGFPHHGEFRRSEVAVALWGAQGAQSALVQQRQEDFGLTIAPDPASALREADAVVIAGPMGELFPTESWVREAIELAPTGTPIFVHGLLASKYSVATELARLAQARRCPLLAGTALPFAFRLPEVAIPTDTRLREALIVVQGAFPAAEFDGLEGLLPVLETRKNSANAVRRLRYLEGDALWRAGEKGGWSRPLFEAAISRSHTPQGNPVLDGRTEDLVGLGLAPKLARHPRGWILEHADRLRSALLVLDGVVADINFAVRDSSGRTLSAQLFRTPPPQQEQYSGLVAALIAFFTTGNKPWGLERGLAEVQVIAAMSSPGARSGHWVNIN